jgi:two-component system chemotaxis response regulator CheB
MAASSDGGFAVVVIGASAGGVEALSELFRQLPGDLPAAFLVVLHIGPFSPSRLPEILNNAGQLPAHHVTMAERIEPGKVYVAPPNRHLVVEDGSSNVIAAPKENRTRPAINPLFRTAAAAYGPRVIGVILTGVLDDGTAGLWEIKRRGGIAIVQSPAEALHPQMPQSAIANVDVDYTASLEEIADLITSLCKCEKAI